MGGEPGGFSLSLVTESFAVRALLGSVAAATLAALLVGLGAVRSPGARRAALLAPAVVAALAAVASAGEAFLPRLLVATTAADGPVVELLGEYRGLRAGMGVDVLLAGYLLVALALVARRLSGARACRRHTVGAVPAAPGCELMATLRRLSQRMGVRCPQLLLLRGCPGGAFAVGLRRGKVVVDPGLMSRLDPEEVEGLLAHELAHHARHDGVVALAVGLVRDLAWFLGPLHIAAGWLHREQEESADELASRCTGRPAALASGILKVWDRQERSHTPRPATCAAAPAARLPSSVVLPGRAGDRAWRIITARVERLMAAVPTPGRLRRRTEALLACGVMVVGATTALMVPSWIASDLATEELAFLYLAGSERSSSSVESPALATFRDLAPATTATPAAGTPAATAAGATSAFESRAELLAGQRRSPDPARLRWGSRDHPAWTVRPPGNVRPARPLVYTHNDTGTQMGVFVVGAAEG